jgi:hypothetical protein
MWRRIFETEFHQRYIMDAGRSFLIFSRCWWRILILWRRFSEAVFNMEADSVGAF